MASSGQISIFSTLFIFSCILKLKPGMYIPCQTCLKEGHLTLPNVTYQFLWPILGHLRMTIFFFEWKKTSFAGGETVCTLQITRCSELSWCQQQVGCAQPWKSVLVAKHLSWNMNYSASSMPKMTEPIIWTIQGDERQRRRSTTKVKLLFFYCKYVYFQWKQCRSRN